jgi:flagellar protein FliL
MAYRLLPINEFMEERTMPEADDLDLYVDGDEKPSSGKGKLIALVGGGVLLLGLGGAGAYFMLGGEKEAVAESANPKTKQVESSAKAAPAKNAKAHYIEIKPEFTINLNSEDGKNHFLLIKVCLLTRDPMLTDKLKLHIPLIKNDLLNLFTSKSYENLTSAQGKVKLRNEALTVVQQSMDKQIGANSVEAVLFTKFVME